MSLTSDLTRRNKNGDKIFCNSVLVSEIMSSTTIINLKCHFKTLFFFWQYIMMISKAMVVGLTKMQHKDKSQ